MGDKQACCKDFYVVQDIKEKVCYVAEDFTKESGAALVSRDHDMEFLPPDNRTITIPGHTRIIVPELLFAPQLDGFSEDSLPKAIVASIAATKMSAHASKFYGNIVLTGNSSRFPGLRTRLQSELKKLASGTEVNVMSFDDFKAWTGTMM